MDLKTLKDTPPWEWPESAGDMLLGIIKNDRAEESDRLLAAELAGDYVVINDGLVHALLSILQGGDYPEDLRATAAISLGPVLDHADTDGFEDPDDVPITEDTFHRIQESLQKLYLDAGVPTEVRRRILEASVRAPWDWHRGAIRGAYFSADRDWKLTAVFGMRFVGGFDDRILESLESGDPEIHYQAVCAAGEWELDAAWPHVEALVVSKETEKPLLLAAIEALAGIRPQEAGVILVDLTDSDDEDIAEVAQDAMVMAEALQDDEIH